jgi:hypothetical protein
MDIFVYKNDEQQGPFTVSQVKDFVTNGTFSKEDLAWYEGLEDWQAISTITALNTVKKSIVTQVKKTAKKSKSSASSSSSLSSITSKVSKSNSSVTSATKQTAGGLFHLLRNGNSIGPFSMVQIKAGVKASIIKKTDKACVDGSEDWIQIKKIPGF